MKKLFGLMIVFSAGAVAQGPDFFQAPGAVQVHELNRPFVGGTYLGVNLAEIDANRAKELKLKEDYGVEISRVEENSPAEKAGVKTGDVVLEYNGQRVEGMEQFGRMVRETPPGREAKLTISRNGAVQTLTAVLGLRKFPFSGNFPPGFEVPEFHMPDIPQIFTTIRSPMLGVEAESLGTQLAVYFGVKEGVLVRSVLENTPAQKAGIKAGDVITKVDGMAVSAPSELSNAVRAANAKKTYAIELVRDRKPVTLSVNVEDRSERWIPRGRTVQNSVTN
ncbi:MAG TPA: PDZ domain-containing protein [Bryobacteraceae bacterium]|jgi:serine protease Do|nr:PDZ domain-containing protein [Bryobacteraceae bacterium]